ncbi:MAG: hypothetical protein GY938_27185 [Ketobacter sp.]|nr:hypothetical protein [Ketobacter sp.]
MTVTIDSEQINQDFFNNFNWDNFAHGDIVWLEDCEDTPLISAFFQKKENGTVNLVPMTEHESKIAIKYSLDSIYPMFF